MDVGESGDLFANRESVCDHGHREARRVLCDVASTAVEAVHPEQTVPRHLAISEDTLTIDGQRYNLAAHDIYALGIGKGSAAVVAQVADILGDRLEHGLVVDKHGQGEESASLDAVETHTGSHPIPDAASVQATTRVTEWANQREASDLVIACITGGASALLAAPSDEVTIEDLANLTDLLLGSGAPIEDINAVRKHLSTVKGGQLAELLAPAAVATLVVVDEVAGDPWGPTVPDSTTFADAINALKRNTCWHEGPDTIRARLTAGANGERVETPTPAEFRQFDMQTVILADSEYLCTAAVEAAQDLGYNGLLLSSVIEGESREVGTVIASIAQEVLRSGHPVQPPCILVSGGETTVTLESEQVGTGGPNQEFALSVAQAIDGDPVAALALGTDGTDGPTEVAGGLVDGETAPTAHEHGIDITDALDRHDVTTALEGLGDTLVTGGTGTNLMDLRLILVRES